MFETVATEREKLSDVMASVDTYFGDDKSMQFDTNETTPEGLPKKSPDIKVADHIHLMLEKIRFNDNMTAKEGLQQALDAYLANPTITNKENYYRGFVYLLNYPYYAAGAGENNSL